MPGENQIGIIINTIIYKFTSIECDASIIAAVFGWAIISNREFE